MRISFWIVLGLWSCCVVGAVFAAWGDLDFLAGLFTGLAIPPAALLGSLAAALTFGGRRRRSPLGGRS